LIEIIVALGVMLTVMVAVLPQLVVGLKSAGTARLVTQAKGVAQGELERMRGMPYNVSPTVGPQYVDVLDTYYRDLINPTTTPVCATGAVLNQPQTGWTGYVPATGTARCSYEPASGAFYRSVRPAVTAPGLGPFVVVTATQFLSPAVPPAAVTPQPGYNTQQDTTDIPPSGQIGVTITVLRSERGQLRPITTYTQIQRRDTSAERVRAEATVKAVEVGSVTTDAGPLSASAGQLNLIGSLSNAVTVNANLAATSASLSSGVQLSGATASVLAPPATSVGAAVSPAGALPVGGCAYACWGATRLGPVSATAAIGQPAAGSPSAPLQTMVIDATLPNSGFSAGNSGQSNYLSTLGLVGPPVRLDRTVTAAPSGLSGCAVGSDTATQPSYITASGYVQTLAASVESCAVARTTPISLFPTTFATGGVVRIELTRSSAQCKLTGASHVATSSFDYQAVVQYWNGTTYVTAATVVKGAVTDQLAAVPLTTSVGSGHVLGDYIAAWSSLAATRVTNQTATGAVKVTLPAVVTVATNPLRADATTPSVADPTSGLSIAVGAVSCSAKDVR
jgi:type II secretory pathway pseudopilin PulG